jgi:hypothetical protein
MTEKPITFRHRYDKLKLDEFTTIRGAAQFKRLKIGQVVNVETPDGIFCAKITNLQLKTTAEMEFDFLDADTSYPGFRINSRQDFVKLLNSFRAPAWKQVTMDEPLTIISLSKKF